MYLLKGVVYSTYGVIYSLGGTIISAFILVICVGVTNASF